MRRLSDVVAVMLLVWAPLTAAQEDNDQVRPLRAAPTAPDTPATPSIPARPGCTVFSEDIIVGPMPGQWKREDVTAYRNAPTRLSARIIEEKTAALNAEVLKTKRRKVRIVNSPSKPGAHTMFNTETRFEVTFRQLPCENQDRQD